ncbi:nucleotidyltransferase domain-containing protein [Hymenobacter sp. DH14]|uniref:Nucleotidyltransferase domain-containing protein n=1 Tax=Hymenobacter cyanobacteriorum TaxID=2926463 RepID=A0A9X2ADE2_9BACT|nr:nucleotidyltransferase domain-containing protein [Hymenobacter cyanobacteriorum]MCI1186006.1 nucleotidyltransferase domain-containing protein [Hymenobacter cyanobacteriorum]
MLPLTAHRPALAALCRRHHVQRLAAFGSVLTPAFGPASDVDFVAAFEPMPVEDYADNYLALKFALEQELQRPVDLLEAQALRNPYFRAQVEATQQVIYER